MPPIISVHSGEDAIRSFTFPHMTAWAVVSGRVKFDDAEPAVNVTIQLYREFYSRGRHGYALSASAKTDDRGEYRVHGLEAGAYYVAALYQAPLPPPDAREQRRPDSSGNPAPDLSYAVTFFPEVQKLADAVAVRLTPGQEVAGIDIFLTLVHTVRIHGRVTSAISGAVVPEPSITMRWNDPDNTGSVSAPVNITFDADHNFEIKGVTTGPYLVITTVGRATAKPLFRPARRSRLLTRISPTSTLSSARSKYGGVRFASKTTIPLHSRASRCRSSRGAPRPQSRERRSMSTAISRCPLSRKRSMTYLWRTLPKAPI